MATTYRETMAEHPGEIQKTALVTGASRGLGFEIARLLAARGWAVALVARDPVRIEAAREALAREFPRAGLLAWACDLEIEGSARHAVERAVAAFGGLDLLVNNAGAISAAPFVGLDPGALRSSVALHVLAPAEAMQAAWPFFVARSGGRVVNVSAIEGLVGGPLLSACATGKFGLVGLTESVRAEWAARGVGITLVCPGFLRPAAEVKGTPGVAGVPGLPPCVAGWLRSPFVSMDVRRAAELVLEASERGKPRIVLTPAAKVLAVVAGVAPGLVARVAAAVGRRLWRDPEVAG